MNLKSFFNSSVRKSYNFHKTDCEFFSRFLEDVVFVMSVAFLKILSICKEYFACDPPSGKCRETEIV